jgi:ferritin heavy chain
MSGSRVRMNYSEAVEALVNKQVNMEFYASYVYLAMASFFGRDDQALPGFAKFFRKSADEEREHALKLAHYQALRGGRVVFQVIFLLKFLALHFADLHNHVILSVYNDAVGFGP